MGHPSRTDDERFWLKVEKTEVCWLWTGALNDAGYGRFVERLADGRQRNHRAHRWLWERLNGLVPEGLELDHLCRVRHCVNPAHLEPVDHRTNVLRGNGIAARHAVKTHCPQGHPYSVTNTYRRVTKQGTPGRQCRVCRKAHDARRSPRPKRIKKD